ncbi:MAG: LysR substrate-binding domain-containing protein [Thermoanaerobaculia bacterium]
MQYAHTVNLEMRHLRLVQAIAEEGGVTKAAGRLHLTQSALSHQLKDVEGRLGTRLFLRLKTRMVPTPAGERLLRSAGPLLLELSRVEDDLARLAANREGLLRIATECTTCYHWVPPVLAEYRRLRPFVDVQIVAEATHRPLEGLLAGRLEVAVLSTPTADPRITTTPLFNDEMVAVMAPGHPLAARARLAAEDFRDETVILYTGPDESTLFERVLVPAGVVPRRIMQIQLTEAILEMVKAGLGISCLARWAVSREIASGAIRAIPVGGGALRRRWSAATLKAAATDGAVAEFVQLLARSGRSFGVDRSPVDRSSVQRIAAGPGRRRKALSPAASARAR